MEVTKTGGVVIITTEVFNPMAASTNRRARTAASLAPVSQQRTISVSLREL